MAVESVNPYASIATRDNIARSELDPLPDAYVEARAREDLDSRLTGDFKDGRLVGKDEAAASSLAAAVQTITDGTATADEVQILTLPEDVDGTFVVTLFKAAASEAVASQSLDVTAAALQTAVNATTLFADNEVIVAKVAGRRQFVFTWLTGAGIAKTNHNPGTVVVTETGERGMVKN